MNYKQNNTCLVCDLPIGFEYLNLGDQPLANSYHKGEILEKYPLRMRLCKNCWHSQLSVSVEPSKMFEHYLYISDTTSTLTKYFESTTDYILKEKSDAKSVFEIACNSGLLLEMFQNRGLISCGIDPAKNIRELSVKRNLDVYVDYWNYEFSEKVKKEKGLYDLVVAFHVLPHVQDPNDFIKSCKNIISDKGKIFIQTSQCDMFLNNEFDVIYHEHSSYFTGRSIKELAHRNGLYVSSIIKTDIHSKSFLFSLQKEECSETQLEELINDDTNNGIYTIQKYMAFAKNAENTKSKLLNRLDYFRKNGYTIIGYGAAAKGNTLLNYIDYKLDYVIDDNYMKWGYLMPGTDVEIHSIELLKNNFEKICFVPLAWNFYKEIQERIQKIRNTEKDIFIKYFPEYEEETPLKEMITIKTNFPVAVNSDDHKYPEGVYLDNTINYNFVEEIEKYMDIVRPYLEIISVKNQLDSSNNNKKIRLLDIGCAGGELVCRMNEKGHICVGLEGSDHIVNIRPEMVYEMKKLPLGWKNWKKYVNKNLFTCDVTKEYSIYENSELMQFDIITSFDVFEHFATEDIENVLVQSYKHLKPGGLFIAQIALFNSGRTTYSENTPGDLNYHKSVFHKEWWESKLDKFYKRINYPFMYTNRDSENSPELSINASSHLVYSGIKPLD